MAYVFMLQNIAAKIGGMLTPFGNPQNLYMYTRSDMPDGGFIGIMAVLFMISIYGFTADYQDLLPGVSIGDVGTMISSMAGLMTFREYLGHDPGGAWHCTGMSYAMNFASLAVLTVTASLVQS